MKLLIAIPMHNYSEGVASVLQWIERSDVVEGHEIEVVVLDDHSKLPAVEFVSLAVVRFPYKATIVQVPDDGHLRTSLKMAAEMAVGGKFDAVLVIESDAAPDDNTLASMLDVYQKPIFTWDKPNEVQFPRWRRDGARVITYDYINQGKDWPKAMASVSPTYEWNGKSCYPALPSWFKEGVGPDCYQIHNTKNGRVSLIQAAPFLFSLWQPAALNKITDAMPPLYRLDTALGIELWGQGYIHLRLLDFFVGHVGGGRRSSVKV